MSCYRENVNRQNKTTVLTRVMLMSRASYLLTQPQHWIRNIGDTPKVCFITAFEEFNKEFRELFLALKEKACFLRKPIELHYLSSVIKSELGYN